MTRATYTPAQREAVIRDWATSGASHMSLATKYGAPKATVSKWLLDAKRSGVTAPDTKKSVLDRFNENVIPEPNSGCHLWTGYCTRAGYGIMSVGNRRRLATHIALDLVGRPLGTGQLACHRCDNPTCVNPEHLFAGTQSENIRDAIAKNRIKPVKAPVGSKHHRALVTEDQVRIIRAEVASGVTRKSLAAKYDLTKAAMDDIVSRRSWRHV